MWAEGHHLDGLPVTHKVHPGLPTRPLDDVRGRAVVVERVSGHHILAVGRPAQAEHVSRPAALLERLGDLLLFLPVARSPEAHRLVVRLGSDVLAHGVPRDALHQAAVSRDDDVLFGKLGRVPDDDRVVHAGGGEVAEVLGPGEIQDIPVVAPEHVDKPPLFRGHGPAPECGR